MTFASTRPLQLLRGADILLRVQLVRRTLLVKTDQVGELSSLTQGFPTVDLLDYGSLFP